jgi:capsular exopolysaccharide synthesis family protein
MHIQDTLRHYAQVIRNHFGFILLGVIFGSTITFVISLFLPPVYQASALVKVDSVLTTAATASDNDVFSVQAQAVSYAILVTSPEVLQEAAKKLPGMTVDQLKNVVSDSPVDNTQLIEVRANADNPERAADIGNTVATTFVQFQETQERTRLQNAADELSQNLTRAKINIDTAQQQLTTLQNTHAAEDSIAQQQSQLATYQSTYNAFLSSNEQLQTQEQQVSSMLSVTQLALPPDKPISPLIALNTILAVSMSLLLMIVVALLQDWLDVTIKTVDDVVQLAGLEPLGSVPLGTSTTQLFDLKSEHTDEVKDAYTMLGTPFRMLSRGERTMLVTSPHSGSGTTAAATYLALSLAKVGMRVLLVDANVRHPSLHNIFQRPDTHGLVESLQNMHAFQETSTPLSHLWLNQWETDISNLWLLPVGPLGPYPTSLLHEPALGLFLDRLLGRMPDTSEQLQPRLVDMIIFDTAALEQGTDAYLLAAIADATVLIVEAAKEHKDTVHQLSVTFQQFGAPILGVIINRQQKQHRSYFYAPRRVPTERKVVAFPSLDQAPLLPLPQENSGSTLEQTISQEKERLFVKETLPLQSALNEKLVSDSAEIEIVQPQFKLKRVQSQQGHLPLQPSTPGGHVHTQPLVGFKLPETPAPLPLVYSDITTNMSNNQADEAQEDVPGRSQFAPLLRLSRAVSQRRDNGEIPEA